MVGPVGFEPGTNPESIRGCSNHSVLFCVVLIETAPGVDFSFASFHVRAFGLPPVCSVPKTPQAAIPGPNAWSSRCAHSDAVPIVVLIPLLNRCSVGPKSLGAHRPIP